MRRTLAALGTVALMACHDVPGPVTSGTVPNFAISDGAHGGNPFVFFLPPLVPQPVFEGALATGASPSVVICTLADDACGSVVTTFGPSAISIQDGYFQVNWKTGPAAGISSAYDYRIEIRASGLLVGFRDVDPKETPTEVPSNPEEDALYAFLNGSTIPIKFRLEAGFLCAGVEFDDVNGECNEGNLRDGVIVQIPETGTGVSVPPQSLDLVVAIVVEPCPEDANLPVDLPLFGGCFEVRSTPAIPQALDPLAAVFVCEELPELDQRQEALVRLHKSEALDGSAPVFALPNAPGLCPTEVAAGPAPGSLLARTARAVGSGLGRLFAPRSLHAALLDRGKGGLTGGFSFFQFALPAKMEKAAGDGQVAEVGTPVAVAPAVLVTDLDGFPVAGATVRFEVITGGGTVVPTSVVSGPDGISQVASWTLGSVGLNQLRAFGRGLADPVTNGPQPFFDPFKPIPLPNPYDEVPVRLETGELIFTATGCADGSGTVVIDGVLEGAWACAGVDQAFTANVSGGAAPARLLVMNDATNLYIAVAVRRASADRANVLAVEFDDGDGVAEAGEDVVELALADGVSVFRDLYRTAKCVKSGQAACGEADLMDGGTTDGSGAFLNDGTWSVYEIAHPLRSGDAAHDIQLDVGDVASFFIALRLGNGAQGNTEYPGFRVFLPYVIR